MRLGIGWAVEAEVEEASRPHHCVVSNTAIMSLLIMLGYLHCLSASWPRCLQIMLGPSGTRFSLRAQSAEVLLIPRLLVSLARSKLAQKSHASASSAANSSSAF